MVSIQYMGIKKQLLNDTNCYFEKIVREKDKKKTLNRNSIEQCKKEKNIFKCHINKADCCHITKSSTEIEFLFIFEIFSSQHITNVY